MCKICKIMCLLCIYTFALAPNQLEVSAKKIESDLKRGQTILEGEVFVAKGEDKLWADKVVIETNKKNQPIKYTAMGNVRFYTKMPNKEIRGSAKKALYDVFKDEYQLIDQAMIEEVGQNNSIKGSLIVLNPTTEEAFVKGSNESPGVFTFIMEESQP